METLKSILTDLDNGEITKHQAYDLINVLFGNKKEIKSSGDFRDDNNHESQQGYFGNQ